MGINFYICSLIHKVGINYFIGKYLSQSEIERANKFMYPEHRERYMLCRYYLRIAIERSCGLDARDIIFEYTEMGRPFIKNCIMDFDFNLSHSSDFCVIAVSRVGRVGVDIEHVRANLFKNISNVILNESELARCQNDASDLDNVFLKYWVAKEAFLKLNGTGFFADPKTVHVSEAFDEIIGSDLLFKTDVAKLDWIDVGKHATCVLARSDMSNLNIKIEEL